MKTKRDYGGEKRHYFKPELDRCPHCGDRLRRSHVAWKKHIITLKGILYGVSYAYMCPNHICPYPDARYQSAEAEGLSLKYYQVGIDVIVEVGYLRLREHLTYREIRRKLRKCHRIALSTTEVRLLTQVYLILVSCSREQDAALIEKLRSNGGITLSIDGIQPEKGNETLYILRDVTSGEVLKAKNLSSSDTASIAALLKEVKALGVPVLGVISDGQTSIRLAVQEVLPNVPHQLCQFHYLKNIAKPISNMDQALKKDMKKRIRGIKRVENKAMVEGGAEAKVIIQYCRAIRSSMLDDGLYPLKPPGLKLYRRLRKIRRSIEHNERNRAHIGLSRLKEILKVLDELEQRYRRIRRLYKLVFEVRDVLNQEADAETVKASMQRYVDNLNELRFKTREENASVQNILQYTRSFWPGLFHHYDHPHLPKTNNALEIQIRFLKAGYRKTTGRASCQDHVLRYGAYVVLVDLNESRLETASRFRSVSYDSFLRQRREFESVQDGFRFNSRVKRDLGSFLRDKEAEWASAA